VAWLADLRRPWWRVCSGMASGSKEAMMETDEEQQEQSCCACLKAKKLTDGRLDWEGTHLIGEVKLGMGEATNTSGSLHSIWRSKAVPYLTLRLTQLQLLILPDYAFDSPVK
jgi:hypothetical protein